MLKVMTTSQSKSCRLCSSKLEESTTLKNKEIYWHCKNCFFTGLDEKFFLKPEDEKARYDLHENSIVNQGYVDMFEDFISYAITPYKESVKTILDYGSGPDPVLAQLLKGKGYEVESYDPIYNKTDLSDKKFDLICSTEAFEHFYQPRKEIHTIKELMKTDSYLAIMTRFMIPLEQFKSWFYKDDPSHVSFYELNSFEFIAKEYGFEIIKNDGFKKIVLKNL